MIVLHIKDYGDIKLELDHQSAPISAKNFTDLVQKGFYDGLIFHRIIKGFMIQGGDPTGTGMGGPGYTIKGEFRSNGVKNPISHKRGVISMARSQHPDSAGSQFFICDANDEFLDGQYAAFGKVIEGMEVVDKIASTPKNHQDRPLTPVVIEKAEVVD
ncbi:MAG: peptidylprolyl isomerase [Bacilli bacterium]|nr:peptidylprolyl isomerase [Bacilli bacterium]